MFCTLIFAVNVGGATEDFTVVGSHLYFQVFANKRIAYRNTGTDTNENVQPT